MLFLPILAVAFAPPELPPPKVDPPGPLPVTVAAVQSKQVVREGKLIKTSIKFLQPGTYYVVAGYVVDYDHKFQFLKGKKSGTEYFAVRKVVSEKPVAIVEMGLPIKVPPLVKPIAHVAVFSSLDHIPVRAP
jgi:hypothetical protein